MDLIGREIGSYHIVSLLGAGGMGEVYRARDTRLLRDVAIKILPGVFTSDPERAARFEREARALAAISHPNICTIHDVGREAGIDYLVMEYVQGETLTARLKKGALPLRQALQYATEMADALDKAHRAGVVHRDLKPSNVMVTKAGVKLLDFGLAKLRPPDAGGGLSSMVTTEALTQTGTLLGTVPYMAPEQLEGQAADERTDIFALGTTLYEMLTGQRAFTAPSQASLIAAILHSNPQSISTLNPLIPPAVDRIVAACLAKDPDERWQSARDIALALKGIVEGESQFGAPAPVANGPRGRKRFAWTVVAIACALVGIAMALLLMQRQPPEQPRQVQLQIFPPDNKRSRSSRRSPRTANGLRLQRISSWYIKSMCVR